MALKEVLKYLKRLDGVTPVTPEKIMGLQREPSVYAGCTRVTPVTPQLDDTQQSAQFWPVGEASNDPEPPTAKPSPAPAPAPARKPIGQTHPDWAQSWRPLADAYHSHHFTCPVCIAAGKGYGLRCGAGAALWTAYTDHASGNHPGSAPETDTGHPEKT